MTQSPPVTELNREELDKVLDAFDIPTCPALVSEVMQEARKDEPDLRRLASIISSDVGMSGITLKMANSALFRSGNQVDNVQSALQRLGMRNVLSVVLGVALRSSMSGLPPEFIEKFWARSSALALAAGMIARRQYGISADTAYTYALFHDAAIPLMLRRFPDYGRLIEEAKLRGESRIQAERQLPCTHPIVGSLLVRNWGLPASVAQAIRFHHELDVYTLQDKTLPGEAVSLIAVGHISEYLLAELTNDDDNEVSAAMFESALDHLGISLEETDALRDLISSAVAEVHQA